MVRFFDFLENNVPYHKRDILFSFTFVVTMLLTFMTLGAFGPTMFGILFVIAGVITVFTLFANIVINGEW